MEYIDELEHLLDAEAIRKGSWLEAFKFAKDITEMYGGQHWRSIKATKELNSCREAMEEIHNKRLKFEGKHG